MILRLFFLVFIFFSVKSFSQSSFYSLDVLSASGDTIHFSSMSAKKILLVNVGSTGSRTEQLFQLESLWRQYKDSGLVIIAFPSNDFNTEPKSGSDLQNFYSTYHFVVAAKAVVKGSNKSPVYNWLAQQNNNAVVGGDYQKFLISREGQLVGIYSGMMPPFDDIFIKALQRN